MRIKIWIVLLLAFVFFQSITIAQQDKTKKEGIFLTINNIRNKTGLMRIGVFLDEKGYPDAPAIGYSIAKDTIKNNRLRIFIPLAEQGSIAISVLDDENANGKMDFIFGIMPKEGFGFSNNPPVRSRKAPPFSITSFVFKGGNSSVTVDMKYI